MIFHFMDAPLPPLAAVSDPPKKRQTTQRENGLFPLSRGTFIEEKDTIFILIVYRRNKRGIEAGRPYQGDVSPGSRPKASPSWGDVD
jgi:hypothetical protein